MKLHFWVLPCVLVLSVAADAAGPKYQLRHNFDLELNLAAGQSYRGAWQWSSAARAVSSVDGTDNGVPANNFGSYAFNPPKADVKTTTATRTGATATSQSQFNATILGDGFHEVSGNASVVAPAGFFARADSFSALGLNVGTKDRKGVVHWKPEWSFDSIKDGVAQGRDPIMFYDLDLDSGFTQTVTVWDTGMILEGDGTSTWAGGDLHIDGGDGSFYLTMESPFLTTGTGHMNVTFANGLITASDDAGVFDGLLPSVGASSHGFDIHIGDPSGVVDLGFDLGPTNVNGFDFTATFDTNGTAIMTPEPGTWIALGLGATALARRRRR